MAKIAVISLGGSIIAPNGVDVEFLKNFYQAMKAYLNEDKQRKLILVCGGGAPARVYQKAYKEVLSEADSSEMDWIGIQATHLNGRLVKAIFASYCKDALVTNPTLDIKFEGQVLVAAGWKPGFSTDTDAVYLANKFNAKLIINLSNIKKVYSADPKNNPDAVPLDEMSWEDFIKMVGSEWVPGKNTPFDPVASPIARDNNIKVICADGRNVENTLCILKGQDFVGTTIG